MRLHRTACLVFASMLGAAVTGSALADQEEKAATEASSQAESDDSKTNSEDNSIQVGDVLTVKLDALLPTQPVLAFDRVFASLGRYEARPAQMFDDLCLTNGGQGVKTWDDKSQPTDLESYSCKEPLGSNQDALPTVLLAPDGKTLYLLSGHHILTTFWDMPNGGTSVPVVVKVTQSLAGDDIDEIWSAMKEAGQIWLFDIRGEKIKPSELPEYLGMKQLKHDRYLSLVFFLRNIAYSDPDTGKTTANPLIRPMSVPYMQYHWAQYLRKKMKVSNYDLNDPDEYTAALKEAANLIVAAADDENIASSGKTAKELGQFDEVNTKALDSLVTRPTSSWSYALAYRQRVKEESTPKRILEAQKAEKESAKKEDKPETGQTEN
ncbi:ParB/Srx family N-terminal domain-containing protein [Photobacterium halotolerans]|uniref:ParB/Srx family N-terminal domain-containing protein n=1 Tax=Photobacterium halotolerans TaxID=265726 RepID=UPI00040AC270|nr:ParB/Srx family N-terminal domain-containing protein [Photobacterium halotolerans]